MVAESHLPVRQDGDIVLARQAGRALAAEMGFSDVEQTVIATAISEIARNVVEHAGWGEMHLSAIVQSGRRGIAIVARDEGPGISDIPRAMQDGFTTGRGLGMGLPGARRLMDEFEITSAPGRGTTVRMIKWRPARA